MFVGEGKIQSLSTIKSRENVAAKAAKQAFNVRRPRPVGSKNQWKVQWITDVWEKKNLGKIWGIKV